MANVTFLPLTSTQRRLYPSEVLLPAGKTGEPLELTIIAYQIRTISIQRLEKTIGRLEDREIQLEVKKALKEHLDFK